MAPRFVAMGWRKRQLFAGKRLDSLVARIEAKITQLHLSGRRLGA